MRRNLSLKNIALLERRIIRALCVRSRISSRWKTLFQRLEGYHWQEPDHAVVYEALLCLRGRDPKTWREQLPAQTTRMGFPYLDWSIYLAPAPKPNANIEDLIMRLRANSALKR
jgi:hypothetical protein